jgi:transposase
VAKITSAEIILPFRDLQARHPTETAIDIVLDNARYNHSADIKAYLSEEGCKIKLIDLPAYAPNITLIEQFWWLLKRRNCSPRLNGQIPCSRPVGTGWHVTSAR